ncbi:hypothetical protein TVAG_396080 [Trichomonas vaginalis G3]|uniref:Uncharacterized protein n=1 Tax=Trichomonas vaginalis (strain ATCC PRA-98 / G3) TaxID=412133 RepID=A2G613_TRIV3|nr:hypothetical protein TVAGG3_0212710 [Trichomonas vaginalis G3]EAX87409.1 hypothetical protein TVAG_396080 [Trichomonas vaginalis G3]KAI5551348.1 hypothetical protein TVAGG3_0212710 [Trichomonas vaginalis G3]|eukprot:XP_001300339.1 hypothetical protein [Trichomonas vaginalis G3]
MAIAKPNSMESSFIPKQHGHWVNITLKWEGVPAISFLKYSAAVIYRSKLAAISSLIRENIKFLAHSEIFYYENEELTKELDPSWEATKTSTLYFKSDISCYRIKFHDTKIDRKYIEYIDCNCTFGDIIKMTDLQMIKDKRIDNIIFRYNNYAIENHQLIKDVIKDKINSVVEVKFKYSKTTIEVLKKLFVISKGKLNNLVEETTTLKFKGNPLYKDIIPYTYYTDGYIETYFKDDKNIIDLNQPVDVKLGERLILNYVIQSILITFVILQADKPIEVFLILTPTTKFSSVINELKKNGITGNKFYFYNKLSHKLLNDPTDKTMIYEIYSDRILVSLDKEYSFYDIEYMGRILQFHCPKGSLAKEIRDFIKGRFSDVPSNIIVYNGEEKIDNNSPIPDDVDFLNIGFN